MTTVDDAAAATSSSAEQARQLAAGIALAKETVDKLTAALAQLNLEDKTQLSGGIGQDLGSVAARTSTIADDLDQLANRVNALRALLTAGRARGPAGSSATAVDHHTRDPAKSAAIRRFGWPKNQAGRTSARGLLYGSGRKPVLGQPLKALRKGLAYPGQDLKEPWRSNPDMTTTWHIEGGAAAYMRQTTTKVMSLWLNVPTCGGPDRPDPQGCHENLPKILPEGYTLHVHVEKANGEYRHTAYRGTGEGLL